MFRNLTLDTWGILRGGKLHVQTYGETEGLMIGPHSWGLTTTSVFLPGRL